MFNFSLFLSNNNLVYYTIYYIILALFFFIFMLLTIALFTVVERKIMAALQKRKGPNVHGFWGALQAFADGLKLLLKEDIVPSNTNYIIFRLAPIYTFFISLSAWAVIPFSFLDSYTTLNISIMYLFALSSLGVYGIILSGWASNSKYSFLGSLRSAAQMISYEVSIGFILICIILISNSLNIVKIVEDQSNCWNIFPFFPLFFLFFISIIAETNRAPFDLPEAEAELVSGYNVEYGAISFALFFLAEYGNILLMSSLTVLFFLGGWNPPFFFFFLTNIFYNYFGSLIYIFWFTLKLQLVLLFFVWIRVAFPRYRYDQLMYLGWKVFLPFSLFILFILFILFYQFDIFPTSYSVVNVLYCIEEVDEIVEDLKTLQEEQDLRILTNEDLNIDSLKEENNNDENNDEKNEKKEEKNKKEIENLKVISEYLFNEQYKLRSEKMAEFLKPQGEGLIYKLNYLKPTDLQERFDHDFSGIIWQKYYYSDFFNKYFEDKHYEMLEFELQNLYKEDIIDFINVLIYFLELSYERELNVDELYNDLMLCFKQDNILNNIWYVLWKIHNFYYDTELQLSLTNNLLKNNYSFFSLDKIHCTAFAADYIFSLPDFYIKAYYLEHFTNPRSLVLQNTLQFCHNVWKNYYLIYSTLSNNFLFVNESIEVLIEYKSPNKIKLDDDQYSLFIQVKNSEEFCRTINILYDLFNKKLPYNLPLNNYSKDFLLDVKDFDLLESDLKKNLIKLNRWWTIIMAMKRKRLLNLNDNSIFQIKIELEV